MDAVTKLEKLNENFLTCCICSEVYKDPCTLSCGHTFCKGCLKKYLRNIDDPLQGCIPCPYCRQATRVSHPDGPVEEWVKPIKPSFLIQGLLDMFAPGDRNTQDVSEHMCVSCTLLGEKRDVVEFCCRDCNKAVCLSCCTLHHRTCESVMPIQTVLPEVKSVLMENKDRISKQLDDTRSTVLHHQSRILEISQKKLSLELQIRIVSQRATDLIKQKETQLLNQLNETIEKQSADLKGQVKSGKIDIQMYQQYVEYITQVMKSESETEMLDIYQMCQSGAIKEATERNVHLEDDTVEEDFIFIDEFNERAFHTDVRLGRLERPLFDVTSAPVLSESIDVRLDSDKVAPDAADVVVVFVDDVEALVVTDWSNKCLKSLYTLQSRPHQSKLTLKSNPFTVTKLRENQVAVSFWSYNAIVIAQVTPDLLLMSTIKTKKKYRCLTSLSPSTLAAGCMDPSSVDVLDMAGVVLRTFSGHNTGKNLIREPWFLSTTNKGNILVSDGGSGSVFCVTLEGEVVFTYTPTGGRELKRPRGITTTSTGHILVADYWTERLVLLTKTGEFIKDLLMSKDGAESLCGVFLHGTRLFVTESSQRVKVFEFKRTQSVCRFPILTLT
ncbi:tripartite motif-containing protein 2-like [Haliotis rufescens]|uniref:tripartite motif-containing protein 2-like n=1 Tax=Haliotis rufescens TaxID=6454 RepID=UPI001EB0A22A|nr:tripartite motif-containing protein 2-like [Haliotis rufescens]